VQNNEGEQQAADQIAKITTASSTNSIYFSAQPWSPSSSPASISFIPIAKSSRGSSCSPDSAANSRKNSSTPRNPRFANLAGMHDEFGQVLTAIGVMLGRAGKQSLRMLRCTPTCRKSAKSPSPLSTNIRSLSQALHPVLLDEAGLESTLDWYIPTVERQLGLTILYEKSGARFPVDSNAGVQIYRILQEALSNVSRHSGVQQAWVRLLYLPDALVLEVEDHGQGILCKIKMIAHRPGRHARTRGIDSWQHGILTSRRAWHTGFV